MTDFNTATLPGDDWDAVRSGRCPWCLVATYDGTLTGEFEGDICPECGDRFYHKPVPTQGAGKE